MNEPNIFLLIGQSNMAGRGRLNEVPELRHPQVLMFREGRWTNAVEPLHADKPKIAGIGLGMSFAIQLIAKGSVTSVGLVPCAVGGTTLNQWMPGADLYENAVVTARSAMARGRLSGILWHQGEGDSGSRDDAVSYGGRFREMIQSLRSHLAAESIPVIAGELGSFLKHREGNEFFAVVNEQLRQTEGRLPGYACVSAEGMQDNGDSLHFSALSLREFGIRYANRFLDMTRQDKASEPGVAGDA